MSRVWVPAGGDRAADSPDLLEWLDHPYAPARGDVNLNPTRIGPLLDLFGGISKFAHAARSAEMTSRRELARVSDLVTRCEEARKPGVQAIAVQRAQAQARHAAARMITDTESYLVDVRVAGALTGGLLEPHVKLVSVVCLVRGELVAARRVS